MFIGPRKGRAPDPLRFLSPSDDPALARPAFSAHLARMNAVRLRAVSAAAAEEARSAVQAATTKAARHAAKPKSKSAQEARHAADQAERDIAAEEAAERFVPAVQRQDVVDPEREGADGGAMMIRAARWRIEAGRRPCRNSMLLTLSRRSRSVTLTHLAAAAAYEHAHMLPGAGALRSCLEERIGSGVPGSGNSAVENGLGRDDAKRALRAGVGLFGCTILDHVVIAGADVASWAAARTDPVTGKPMLPAIAMGILIAVLERLVEVVNQERTRGALWFDALLEKLP